jgi:hypothetical protein
VQTASMSTPRSVRERDEFFSDSVREEGRTLRARKRKLERGKGRMRRKAECVASVPWWKR